MKNKISKIIIVLFLSVISGFSFGLRVLGAGSLSGWAFVLSWLIPALIFGVLFWLFDRTAVYQRFTNLPVRKKVRWLLIAGSVFLLLLVVLPYEKPVIRSTHTLQVTSVENMYAPEERPVVIERLYFIQSGESLPFDQLELEGWEDTPEGLASTQTDDTFRFTGTYADGIILVAPTEFEYGMLEITYDGHPDRYNLYGYPAGDPDYITLSKHSWGSPTTAWLLAGIVGIAGDVWLLFFALLVVLFWLGTVRAKPQKRVEQPAYMILLYAVPLLLVWTVFLLSFWPGIIPYDPLSQLSQAQSGVIYDDHPAIHTIFMQIMLNIWDSPAPIVIIRYILLSMIVGYGIWTLRRAGIPAWTAWVLSGLFAISPVTTTTSINLWKDVPYAAVFLLLGILIFQLIMTRGKWLDKTLHWISLGVVLALVAVFRHNGILPVITVIFFGVILFWKYWKKWAGVLVVTVVIYLLIVNPLYGAFNVQEKSAQASLFGKWMGFGLAAYVYEEADMPTERMLYLDSIMAVKTGWNYDCYSFSRAYGTGEDLFPGGRGFLVVLIERVVAQPGIYWQHWACNTEHLWRLRPNDNPMSYPWAAFVTDINPSTADFFNLDFASDSRLPGLKESLKNIQIDISVNPKINWLVWRPALYFYAALAASLLAFFRSKNKGYLLFFVLLVAQTASIGIGVGSAWVRYSFPMMVTALLFWPLLFWQPQEVDENDPPATVTT